jgi:17beta-estradiol 17-dehydrogenase / very-long-chain 3-oxoacyl-CoA reductase
MLNFVALIFGILLVAQFLKDLLFTVYVLCISKDIDLGKLYGKNSYVIITGGSKGIGFGFAKEFASRGFNLLLIARNEDDLKSAQSKIQAQYPTCKCLIKSFDFNSINRFNTSAELQEFLGLSKDLDVSVLINNVGMANRQKIYETSEEQIKKVITVNCLSQFAMTDCVLPLMQQRSKLSCIIHVGSLSSKQPLPWFDLYGATKSFNQYYCSSLQNNKFIDNYLFSPGFVRTELSRSKENYFKVSVDESVKSAMKFVGRHRVKFYGHWKHELLHYVFWLVPFELGLGLAKRFLGKVQNK